MFTINENTTFSKTKRETKKELAEKASQDINEIIVNYMNSERNNILETLSSKGITGEKAEKVLSNLKMELQAYLMVEVSKNVREL